MEQLRKDIQAVRESQIRMEADLKYHILRTDLLEKEVAQIDGRVNNMTSSMSFKEKLQLGAVLAAVISAMTTVIDLILK